MSLKRVKPANMEGCWPQGLRIFHFRILFSWAPEKEAEKTFKIIPGEVILSSVGELTPRFWEPSITDLV